MSEHGEALAWAEAEIAAARDDPAARPALMERLFHGPTAGHGDTLPLRRAALSFPEELAEHTHPCRVSRAAAPRKLSRQTGRSVLDLIVFVRPGTSARQ